MGMSADHYVYAAHMKQWATGNKVTVIRRDGWGPRVTDIGKKVAAQVGLNDSEIEAAYGKVEDAFLRALRVLQSPTATPANSDWEALRAYAVLMHDRYPALRGSAETRSGLPGGNIMMPPNPEHWGSHNRQQARLGQLATSMDRELLKTFRLTMLPTSAKLLPPVTEIHHATPLIIGDAGIHSISLHGAGGSGRSFLAMPLTPNSFATFSSAPAAGGDSGEIARILNWKIAAESTVVIDTLEAPLIKGFVAPMWSHAPGPVGFGQPQAVHVYDRVEDIPRDGSTLGSAPASPARPATSPPDE